MKIVYLNSKRGIVNPETAEKISICGCVIDRDSQLRKVQSLGGGRSSAVTLPEGWLKSVSVDEFISAKLILAEGEETFILLCKPKPEEVVS